MVFVESTLFTRLLDGYLADDDYRQFQNHLAANPAGGVIIRGSGGVRKVRWRAGGRGKAGGIRVIYYWASAEEQIFLLTLYGKGEKEDLSAVDLKRIVRLVAEIKHG